MAKHTVTLDLTPEQEKTLLTDMVSIDVWLDNAFKEVIVKPKLRKLEGIIISDAMSNTKFRPDNPDILDEADKQSALNMMVEDGVLTVEGSPRAKAEVIKRAKVLSASEKDAIVKAEHEAEAAQAKSRESEV